jgi:dephospho-CoA kinase
MIIGITGSYCSGKDSASRLFAEHGFAVVDVDRVGYEALEVKREDVAKAFGSGVLTGARVDRKKLGRIVFGDGQSRKKLESIVHPWMIRRVKALVQGNREVVINAALLVEMCLFVLCDYVLGVRVPEEEAVVRGMRRDSLSREEALSRLRSQIPLKEKIQYVDKIIENNGSFEEFADQIIELIGFLRGRNSGLRQGNDG